MKPAGWQEGKQYPLILTIHGSPSGMFGMNWMIDAQCLPHAAGSSVDANTISLDGPIPRVGK
jgi:hypothetical protein